MSNSKSKKEQLKAIKRGRGAQYILDEAYRIFGNPMVIFDMEYILIASSEYAVGDDPIWNEFMTHGKLGAETIEFCKNESFIDAVANSTMQDGVTYLISEKLKYDRIFGQIYNINKIPVANLVAVGCENPFDEDTSELIKIICRILSDEFSKSDTMQNYGQEYQEGIIKKLIEGSIEDKGLYSGHVANIDKNFNNNIFAAVADISQCDPTYGKLVFFRDLFKQAQPSFKYAIYSKYIVILIGSRNEKLDVRRDLKKIYKLFEQHNIYVGISNCFENLYELNRYYFEALSALNDGMKSKNNQRFFNSEPA